MPTLIPQGSGSILAEAGVTAAALRPAIPAAAPRKPRRDVCIFIDRPSPVSPILLHGFYYSGKSHVLIHTLSAIGSMGDGPHLALRNCTQGATLWLRIRQSSGSIRIAFRSRRAWSTCAVPASA